MSDESVPSKTVTRPDNDVGKPGVKPAAGARQAPQQAEITRIEPGGRSDEERERDWGGGIAGDDPAIGGSSGGHSDKKRADPSGGGRTM